MLLFLVKRKHNESTGHCGFGLLELQSLLDEMEEAGEIVKKRTINSSKYFLK